MHRGVRIAMGAFILALAGCAAQPKAPPGPANYQQGYEDGCASGYKNAGHPYAVPARDWNAYQIDALYKQGWDEGQNVCFERYQQIKLQTGTF